MLIYIAQLIHEISGVSQILCFPLAAGYIGAYLKASFGKQIEVEIFKKTSDLNQAFDLRPPDVLMLSLYMWNHNLTLAYAKQARLRNPDLLIVLGGPNISVDEYSRQCFMAAGTLFKANS